MTKTKKYSLVFSAIAIIIALTTMVVYFRAQTFDTVHPHRGEIIEAVYGLGKVKSSQRYEIVLGVLSTVKRRFVNEGDVVKSGAPLIQFDGNVLFRAPFDGTITYTRIHEGEVASPNVPQLRLENLSHCYIELSLEQSAILNIKPGQTAKISFESKRGQIFSGKVISVFPRDDEFITHVAVDNLDLNILPGMTADVTIEIGAIQNALLIPLSAISNGMVTVHKKGQWQKIKVDIGRVDGLSAEIKNDTLTAEDELRVKKAN